MLVPLSPSSYANARPRRTRLSVVLLLVLLALLVAGGAVVVGRGGHTGPAPVTLERRSQWRGSLVAAQATHAAAAAVQPQHDMERLALAAAHEFGMTDTLALAVMEQESGGDPRAVSPVGARGVFQVMPATGAGIAEALGVANYTPAMLDDPALNARFGMYYLNKQITRFGLVWGLAAYNWGPTNVADVLATYPAARTLGWDAVCQQYGRAIPAETQQYVANILAIWARRDQTSPASVATGSAPTTVTQMPTNTSPIVFPIHSTQGTLTLTILSVVRASETVTIAMRLDTAGPVLTVAPSALRVSTARGQVYTLPVSWGTQTVPAHGHLEVRLVCAPEPRDTNALIVTALLASQPPMAITVPLSP